MKNQGLMTNGTEVEEWLERIAEASATSDGVTRLPWTEEHRAALAHIASWMRDMGLDVSLDAAGTLIGASPNPEGKPVLLIGSHQDSVPSGGRFDGIMGIAIGCAAVGALRDRIANFPFALEVLAFADEEGVRFPTALIGPRALAGRLDPAALEMIDQNGETMKSAMAAFGVGTDHTLQVARQSQTVVGYLEAHIEQGPVLEDLDLPVAAVSAICGISRYEVIITGVTGHAGTVPMTGRHDALVAASRIISHVSEAASSSDVRATVGTISVKPGAVNAIPAEVRFSLEIRAAFDDTRQVFEDTMLDRGRDLCNAHGCDFSAKRAYVQYATTCDPKLTEALLAAIRECGLTAEAIPSGATHDASAMANLCPVSMLFVRCRGGVSHRPDEYASAKDMDVAVRVLVNAINLIAQEA